MPEKKWKSFAKANLEQEYLTLISYLPLRSFWKMPAFLGYTRAIENQLKETRGLIGYSLLAHLLSKEFWTLSVWEDEDALTDFVKKGEHKETMIGLRGQLGNTKFVKWKVKGVDVPPTWRDAFRHLESG